ncbi:MAG: CueP family metal-binding protein [Nitrososphaerales archaeon]
MVERDHHDISKEVVVAPSRRRRLLAVLVIVMVLVGFVGLIVYQSSVTAEEDLFYLSVGLYADYTHECYYHIPATCDAQFKSKPVKYSIKSLDGSYEESGVQTTTDKGWLDFYLPKTQHYRAEFEVEGLRGSGILSTEENAPTCISTIKVSK